MIRYPPGPVAPGQRLPGGPYPMGQQQYMPLQSQQPPGYTPHQIPYMPPQRARTNSREEFVPSPLPGPVTGNIAGPSGTTISPILQNSQVHQLNSQGLVGLHSQSRSNSDPSLNENHGSASPPMNRFSETLTPANYNSRIQQQQQLRQQQKQQQQHTQREVMRVNSQSPDQRPSSLAQSQVVSSPGLTREMLGDQKKIDPIPPTLQEQIIQKREVQRQQQLQQASSHPITHVYPTEIVQRNEIDPRCSSRNASSTSYNPNFMPAVPGDDFGLTPLQLQRLKTNNKETLKEMYFLIPSFFQGIQLFQEVMFQ
ncbi:unnamed protein product [Ambrosiozyma monospora]|uniref:Unnamed protein product n=1 Tax=Ambrosiozyma monospora TaxID=43982 RepID=A0A9W6Z8D4_AMBMO|nr:unnamed protein product [Ambrosiozyma monospora]